MNTPHCRPSLQITACSRPGHIGDIDLVPSEIIQSAVVDGDVPRTGEECRRS